MKQLFLMAGIILLAVSCSTESKDVVDNAQTAVAVAPVRVCVNGFSVSQGAFAETRADPKAIGDYENLKSLTLAFYKGSDEVYKHVQYKLDASTFTTFGEFSTSLPMGSYTMVVIGSSAVDASGNISLTGVDAASYSGAVKETFWATQTVTVSNTTAQELSATLDRIIATVTVLSTDGRTADAHTVRTIFHAGGKTIDPTTGLATVNTGFSADLTPSAAVGDATTSTNGLFLATDEQTMDITVQTLDADGNVLFSKVVKDVPLKRNRQTTLTGAMYSPAAISAGSFTVNTDWLPTNTVEF